MQKIQAGGIVRNATPQEIVDAAARDAKNATLSAPRLAYMATRKQALKDNLPSWNVVENAIDAAFPDASQRAIIKKVVRIVYLDQKGKVD